VVRELVQVLDLDALERPRASVDAEVVRVERELEEVGRVALLRRGDRRLLRQRVDELGQVRRVVRERDGRRLVELAGVERLAEQRDRNLLVYVDEGLGADERDVGLDLETEAGSTRTAPRRRARRAPRAPRARRSAPPRGSRRDGQPLGERRRRRILDLSYERLFADRLRLQRTGDLETRDRSPP
jgi:hypothetical protein